MNHYTSLPSLHFLCLIFTMISCKNFTVEDYAGTWIQSGNCFDKSEVQIIPQENPSEIIIQGFGKDEYNTAGIPVRAFINNRSLTFEKSPNLNPENGNEIILSGNGKLTSDGKKLIITYYQKQTYKRPDGRTGFTQGQCSGSFVRK